VIEEKWGASIDRMHGESPCKNIEHKRYYETGVRGSHMRRVKMVEAGKLWSDDETEFKRLRTEWSKRIAATRAGREEDKNCALCPFEPGWRKRVVVNFAVKG
jgi:hypothetical protein